LLDGIASNDLNKEYYTGICVILLQIKMEKITHSNRTYAVLAFLLIVLCLFDELLSKLLDVFKFPVPQNPHKYSVAENIFAALVFAPLIETAFYQYLLHKGLGKIVILNGKTKTFQITYISASAVLFSLSHFYSLSYIIATLVPGIVLAAYFCNLYKRNDGYSNAFYYVWLLHFSKNLVAVIGDLI
jgi:hypothetical protein